MCANRRHNRSISANSHCQRVGTHKVRGDCLILIYRNGGRTRVRICYLAHISSSPVNESPARIRCRAYRNHFTCVIGMCASRRNNRSISTNSHCQRVGNPLEVRGDRLILIYRNGGRIRVRISYLAHIRGSPVNELPACIGYRVYRNYFTCVIGMCAF